MKVKKKITPERIKILALEKQGDSIEFPSSLKDKVRNLISNVNRDMKLNGHVKRDEVAFSILSHKKGIKVTKNF